MAEKKFKLHADYAPTGDQPEAIEKLVRSIKAKNRYQTLLGVTGSGKTFTMANIIERVQRPTLIISHNKRKFSLVSIFLFWLNPSAGT